MHGLERAKSKALNSLGLLPICGRQVRETYTSTMAQDPLEDDIYYMEDVNKYVTTRPLPEESLSTYQEVDKDGIPIRYPPVPDRRIFPHLPKIIR